MNHCQPPRPPWLPRAKPPRKASLAVCCRVPVQDGDGVPSEADAIAVDGGADQSGAGGGL